MNVKYEWVSGALASLQLRAECSNLYSIHYGKWGSRAKKPLKPGTPIRLSPDRLRMWFNQPDTDIYLARCQDYSRKYRDYYGKLIGYAIAGKFKDPDRGVVSWVTQLVVHSNFRKQDIAKTLLFTIWGFTDLFAWGIVSANPYAIRALEKATRRRCVPERIMRNKKKLYNIGIKNVSYLKDQLEMKVDKTQSIVNTIFYVDHSEVSQMVASASSQDVPWLMGDLADGWEWFAFTFQDQPQISLSTTELERMLSISDDVTKEAYSRVQPSNAHGWMRHAENEAKFIIKHCKLKAGQNVIDFGCGTGRHTLALAKKGFKVVGVDYLDTSLDIGRQGAAGLSSVSFLRADCRKAKLALADCILCLYDVIGSYADNGENLAILENISCHLRPGGRALLSVMNYTTTESRAKHRFKLKEEPDKLLVLKPSQIMETTGNVFDPNYFIVDTETRVVYRKEQFKQGGQLPIELLVRDRRFTKAEIESMCQDSGLEVEWSRCVKAGGWDLDLDPADRAAKEILVLCRKPI